MPEGGSNFKGSANKYSKQFCTCRNEEAVIYHQYAPSDSPYTCNQVKNFPLRLSVLQAAILLITIFTPFFIKQSSSYFSTNISICRHTECIDTSHLHHTANREVFVPTGTACTG